MGTLFIISAPSGTGKTSLVKGMVESLSHISVSVSHTTRPARPGEINGVNYHFVDDATFESMLAEGDFLEHAQVYDYHYGTSKKAVADRLAQGRDVILEIEWQGARQVRQAFPNAVSIFILPPDQGALRERLESRGQDSVAVINKRLALAAQEIGYHAEYDYLVVNDQFEVALSDLRSIVRAEHCRQPEQEKRLAALLQSFTS
ncbi:MAG: guanylate kinase [Gammaproteobacteria bacterium CG11_big_fil_rev_8_21_14_0_20_46_22]|nr:MAG: guanylate kinase [Gammaproteobacteria bacterium CG12_big_fil_rev_8_21_14_0_65_46_12]PIR10313.1 MAG: guanylate kinase [Gammaproteobacteria bacterium CG11_big_fil_rev_8_21_14_0_20_46_22]